LLGIQDCGGSRGRRWTVEPPQVSGSVAQAGLEQEGSMTIPVMCKFSVGKLLEWISRAVPMFAIKARLAIRGCGDFVRRAYLLS
jgi:hypothetical protein